MAVKINKGRSLDSMNLTPMIDMVFNLLIFFLVASQFAEDERDMNVNLPSASEARPMVAPPRVVFINITNEGQIVLDRRPVEMDELESILRQTQIDNPLTQDVRVRADKRVEFDRVVQVLNICNRIGIDYRIVTMDDQAPSGP